MPGSTSGPAPARRGPRGSGADTRAQILEAAATVFVAEGFEATSMRAIAREAGVDPGLVRHYFDSKPALFIEALRPLTGEQIAGLVPLAPPPEQMGAWLVGLFVSLWDDRTAGPRLRTVLTAVPSSPEVADLVKAVIIDEVLGAATAHAGADHPHWRASAVASQLVGLAWLRYIMRAEPMASATPAQIVALVGPTVQRYLTGPVADVIA